MRLAYGFYVADPYPSLLTADDLHTHLSNLSGCLCLFVHSLKRLHVELGYTPPYLRYNTDLTVANNGQQLWSCDNYRNCWLYGWVSGAQRLSGESVLKIYRG